MLRRSETDRICSASTAGCTRRALGARKEGRTVGPFSARSRYARAYAFAVATAVDSLEAVASM
jgi:hypothetical protein